MGVGAAADIFVTVVVDRVETSVAEQRATDLEHLLAEVLADVLDVERVSATANFFNDLGADSLVMAHFCARLTKRPDLPTVSIKAVYQNPTVRDLAASVSEADPASAPASRSAIPTIPVVPAQAAPVGRWQFMLCGAMQFLALFQFAALTAFVAARGYDWVTAASGLATVYLRSAVYGGGVFVAWASLGIVAKWLLVGRWRPEQFRIWSMRYLGFWFVKVMVQSNPLVLFVGTPIYVFYLRALGAKVGRNVVILSRSVPVCADLLTIGDNTVVRKDSSITCYRAHAGLIEVGPVTLGADAFVGEATVLDIHTSIGDGAQLGHSSALLAGESIPDGECWVGSPARQRTNVDYRAVTPAKRSALRRATYSIAQLLVLFAVTLPLPIGIAFVLAETRISPTGIFTSGSQPLTSRTFFAEALIFSLVLFVILTLVRLVLVLTIPRILNRAIKPDVTYPLYGIRYWAHRTIARLSNVTFFTTLFGDTSYIVHYLYLLGYKVTFAEQTGANFGLNVKHDNPYHVHVGPGTMAADGLSIVNADYSSTSFRVSPVTIGAHSFIGNNVAYPSQGKTGENCLLASKVLVPVEGDQREDAGFLGSPSFEIPRLVLRDQKFDDMKQGDELARRLAAKNRHNLITIGLFLLTRWVALFGAALLALGAADLYSQFGAVAVVAVSVLATVFRTLYNVLIERASTRFKPLRPMYCSIYDRESWRIERFWKLSWQPALLNGTPVKGLLWRLLGVRVGRRLFDDGALMVEKTMITVGDNCTFNSASVIQPHSQEDGTFKSDYVTIGDGCTLGIASLVHYGVSMGDHAALAPNSFLMKGAVVPPHSFWAENPARELLNDRPADVADETDEDETDEAPTVPAAGDTGDTNGGAEDMKVEAGADREYWRGVLRAGGLTAVPRWTPESVVDDYELVIPDDLVAALRGLADELDISFSAVLLAAHAKVLSSLSGERDVSTGYIVAGNDRALPCRLTTEPSSWRAVLVDSGRVESELLAHCSAPLDDLRRELRLTEPSFETVFDPTGNDSPLAEDTVLCVGFLDDEQDTLRVRYRNNVLDRAAAARTAGYHLAALTMIAADLEAEHRGQTLVSADELHFQLDELAGPTRELPDRRFHELFEQRVTAHPDAVAAMHGHRPWTYRELNSHANQLGRALLARGLPPEGVVAVVTERNLDWMAAVLAIFKAGGVYLPIEPHFPADRIATTLKRAECQFVVTEPGSTATLDEALGSLPGVETILVDAAYDEDHADDDLGVDVGTDQLAYIYFTSGSTGEPKGAMCEHAGLLNHLYAKIDDLGIGDGQTVAQIAPQCFDISLWQLVSALLVGGRALLIEQETILDPERFIDTIVDGRVAVLQVVPSYLEVLLSYLEQDPRNLPELHCVSVTGEALTLELTQRWFATKPGIKLANAYGLTETSDDTNHEVMDQAPSRGGVPLGRAVNNVEVRVVDERLSPVPLGAPGEIVFSGICVGRGYINDPERTRLAYMDDPLREGQRLYRSGDFGRWRPDGKLEFLGRRDAQVKIRGFRIEIGEIENALQQAPGVRNGAVVVTEGSDQAKRLVGFYSGQQLEADALLDRLGRSLPDYMVPTALHWQEDLPLTDNGKVDRKTLVALAGELDLSGHDFQAPRTATEQQLAAAWADVLSAPTDQIGRRDDFFDKGGTSLTAVKLVIALDGAVSLKDVTRNPVLADLAQLVDGGSTQQAGLLQLLSESGDAASGALVCFPYAGGNAINFQAMAKALRGSGLAVYAVELPGHDVANVGEPFASLRDVVEQVVAEIVERRLTPVLLWGHSSGAAFAVEAARQLHDQGVEVKRLILAAQLLGDPADRRAHIAELDQRSDAEIAAGLAAGGGYTELGELSGQHADRVGAAYRHDCVAAHRYLLDVLDGSAVNRLSVPVTAVTAADDPATANSPDRQRDWRVLADHVDVHELDDGGHYFLRTRPTEAADLVRSLAGLPESDTVREVAENAATEAPALIDVDRRPGKPPTLTVDAVGETQVWVAEHRDTLRAIVAEHGAVQIHGLGLSDTAEVGSLAQALANELVVEREAFASREEYASGIYAGSEWPPNQQMCMHHELSYKMDFPGLMLFACLAAPTAGGAIALADSPTVLESLPDELTERFGREGWMLTRNYTDEIGLSVAQAFGTDDRAAVETYCEANAIEFEWQTGGGLRTSQRRSAVVRHPITGQRCWFNQIAFLNEWTMNAEVREFLVDMYGPDGLPFNTRFGNGDPIGEDVVQTINETYEALTTVEPLRAGDLILVDNIRTAHSRQPFEGERSVLVAMADAVRLADISQTLEGSVGFAPGS
jgi:non-ribosomal peptide synthetase-like protein